ncbi:MAG TPA: FAD-binding protein, partial [Blastococcus sp.]|nr:FAD-binding protein [Blastococcus sp.]
MIGSDVRPPVANWAGNHRYGAARLHRPVSLEHLREVVSGASSVHVLGSRHSFNGIADAEDLISLEVLHTGEALPAGVLVDPDARTVSFGAGLKYGELVERLNDEGLALHNLASLPHISVAGAVATATHGSGIGNGN